METEPVSSTSLSAVGYDADSWTLEVHFVNGGQYHYHHVPLHLFESLMAASSKGKYFDEFIKKAGFGYTKIT